MGLEKIQGGGLGRMESINQDDVLLILKLLQESKFDDLCLETGNLKLVARKPGRGETRVEEEFSFAERVSSPASQGAAPEGRNQDLESQVLVPGSKESREIESPVLPPEDRNGAILIQAPLLGTFYRSPKPGAPPFVEVGQRVTEDDVLCIIEVMKLFNTVKAGVRGRIAKILAENGQMVEFQQPLFLVQPAAEEEGKAPGA
jgi:acetyl-CoA carboxylase biotin carboxyl carrier protein